LRFCIYSLQFWLKSTV